MYTEESDSFTLNEVHMKTHKNNRSKTTTFLFLIKTKDLKYQ